MVMLLSALLAEVDSGNCKTNKIELFEEIVNHFKLTIFLQEI